MGNVESIARAVLMRYPIKRAALFGSAARGDMTEQSKRYRYVSRIFTQYSRT